MTLACLAAIASACQQGLTDVEAKAESDLRLGTRVHAMPHSAKASTQINTAAQTLTYFGGRVVSNMKVVQVLWGSGSYLSNVSSTASPSMATFFQGVLNSAYMDWLDADYNTVSPSPWGNTTKTNQHIGRGSFVGQFTITPASSSNSIPDATIQSELAAQIQAGHLPAPTKDAAGNNNTYYAIFFPHGKVITQGGSSSCVGGGFCAYHGTVANVPNNGEIYYGVHPDMQAGSGCDTGCGTGTAFQNYCSVASHEMIETVTDAEVGLATVDAPPLAWYNDANGEIGDICNAQQGTVVGSDGVTYTVQKEWSNSSSACIATKAVGNDFGVSVSPTSLSFAQGGSGSASIATATTSGSAQTVTLSVTGQPTGMTASITPASVTSGQSATINVSTTSSVASGTYSLTIHGAATSGSHTATLSVTVTPGGTTNDFSLSASPASVSVAQGAAGSSTITASITSGSAQTVSLSVSGAPSGVTASLSPTSISGNGTSTLSISASASAAPGTYALTVTGTATSGSHTAAVSLTVTSSGGGGNVLSNGVPVANISGALNSQTFYSIAVPANQSSLVVKITGSTSASNDADLYVRLGANPTLTTYNCRPYLTGSNETCTITPAAAGGTYFIMLNGYTAYSGVTLTATYTGSTGGGNVLTNGVPVTNISGASGSNTTWTLSVPSTAATVKFQITGSTSATNDADMYVRFGAAPTTSTYDCRPFAVGSNETCNFAGKTGTWYVMLHGYTAYSGVTLTGQYQ